MTRRTRKSRRGFTLIELILASALGVFIVGAVFGLFVVLRASQERTRARSEAMHELATLQQVLAQSFRTLVMLDRPSRQSVRTPSVATAKAVDKDKGDPGAPTGDIKSTDKPGGKGKPAGPARLLLEQDQLVPFPRLEMVVASAPMTLRLADGVPTFVDGERGGGIRGAFEMLPGARPGVFDVHFRAYDFSAGPQEPRAILADSVVCRGLVSWDVKFYKSGSKDLAKENQPVYDLTAMAPGTVLPEDSDGSSWAELPAARSYTHLPAYVEVDAVTEQGARGRWFFEVKWMVGKEPEKRPGEDGEGDGKSGTAGSRSRKAAADGPRGKGSNDRSTVDVFGPSVRPK